MSLIDDFPDTCDVYEPAETQDATGGTVQSFATATISGLPCRVQPRKSSEALNSGRMAETEFCVLYCAAVRGTVPTVISQKARIVLAARPTVTYVVTGVTETNLAGLFLRIEMEARR